MSGIAQFLLVALTAQQIVAYNIYRGNCGCFEARPVQLLQNRMGGGHHHQPAAPGVMYLDNQLKKKMYYDPTAPASLINTYHNNLHKYQMKPQQQAVYYVQHQQGAESEEVDNTKTGGSGSRFDSDNFWKVDEIPVHVGLLTLPDVYVEGEAADATNHQQEQDQDDAPPSITDAVSVEKSELTAETHDLEDVEIEEKYLNDPAGEMEEIIMETVTEMPEPSSTENPAVALLKMAPLTELEEDQPEIDEAAITTTEAVPATEETVSVVAEEETKTEVTTTETKPSTTEKIKAEKTEIKSKKSEGSAKAGKGSKSALL